MIRQRKNYRVIHSEQECLTCRHKDAIREPVCPGDRGKVKTLICELDHLPIEPQGVCDLWEKKGVVVK